MPKKKSFLGEHWLGLTFTVAIIVIAGGLFYAFSNNLISFPISFPISFTTIFNQSSPQVQLNQQTQFYSYNVQANFSPNLLCSGDNVTGTINSNIPNGICSIYANLGAGFVFLTNVNLNANGNYSITQNLTALGTAIFRTICCDRSGNCRIANDISLTVTNAIPPCPTINPDSDGDGNPDATDPDDDNDGWTDEQEIEEGTNPLDPDSHPSGTTENCTQICTSKGFVSGHSVNSASECVGTEVFETNWNASLLCCCTPAGDGGDGEGSLGACEGALVPAGIGDAGGWCAEHSCSNVYHCCDNYWNSVTSIMHCGCTYTFWCQENFDYAIVPGQCECPPHTHKQDGTNQGFFKCVVTQG